MASEQELSAFLPGAEKRALKQAIFAVRDDDAAFDIVQDAMTKLVEKYGDKPGAELSLLFQRILQNTIHDWFCRIKVCNTWVSLFFSFRSSAEGDDIDLLELIESEAGITAAESSADKVERSQMLETLEREIEKFPTRQRGAFLIRYWEDVDVTETAQAMGCPESSVKAHCSRVTHALTQALRA